MDQTPTCPRCGRPTVVRGHLIEGGPATGTPRFLPERMRMKTFTREWWGVSVEARFFGCVTCGLVWSGLDAYRLHEFVREHGSELDRQQLDEWDDGPLRGLPDTALARQVAARVAEIDHLVRSNEFGEAARRYAELTGFPRNQAATVIDGWNDLKRTDKLAHFGWLDKKGQVDDLAEPLV